MTDKEFRQQRARVRKSLSKWLTPLGLNNQRSIYFIYKRDGGPADPDVIASCTPEWEYKHASIWFHLDRMMVVDDEDLDYFVRHELCHILVNQMATSGAVAKKNEERVVTELAQILNWVWRAGAKEAGKKKGKK